MKRLTASFLTLILFIVLLQTGNYSNAQTTVSGIISANTTWTKAGSPYIANSVTVNYEATLTIEAGAVVKFTGSWENINVKGCLKVNGTVQQPVIFTSIKDDSDGQDSNSDGNDTSPQNGNWACISFQPESWSSVINHAKLKYGGGSNTSAAVNIYTSDVVFNNTSVDYSIERGIWMSDCSPDIHDCNFTGNLTDGVYISGLDSIKNLNFYNNTFTDNVNWAVLCDLKENKAYITLSGNSSSGSAHNGFGLSGKVVK